jgi:hypothetical protein
MEDTRATKILAKSLYKKLIHNGFLEEDIINVLKELLDHMEQGMRKEGYFKGFHQERSIPDRQSFP